jgi:hypothetical protein
MIIGGGVRVVVAVRLTCGRPASIRTSRKQSYLGGVLGGISKSKIHSSRSKIF